MTMYKHPEITQEEKKDLAEYVHYVYVENRGMTWLTMDDINAAVEKYAAELVERNDKYFTFGGGDTLDRERVFIHLN